MVCFYLIKLLNMEPNGIPSEPCAAPLAPCACGTDTVGEAKAQWELLD